ncbi:MAG: DNA-binding transcriptional LysR family regulator [Alteromonadaceae bacterium]|jgi:DNA-binding transcriptional LysR family regulator
MLNFDDLSLFTTIVECGSLTLAAKKLAVPKSKLSRRLAMLEEQMGCQLLVRTTRRQTLTQNGQMLYRSSIGHLEALADLENEITSLNVEPKGVLRILLPIEFFNKVISALVTEFAKQYPHIMIQCSHYSSVLPVEDFKYDLILVLHENPLPASNWIGRPLLSFPQSIYAGSDYPIEHLHNLSDIAKEKCISSESNSPWLFRDKQQIQLITINERIVLASPEMRLEAIIQHLGIAKLPDYLCQASGQLHKIKKIELSHSPVALQLTVLYQSRSIAFKTRTFLEYFQSKIGYLS